MVTQRQGAAIDRRIAIADAVIDLLASDGSRRTTHRAVDDALGLPEGSTSAYCRTRASLLAAAARRLADLDRQTLDELLDALDPRLADKGVAGRVIAAVVESWTAPHLANRQVARLELQLEARRSPELADVFAELRGRFVEIIRSALNVYEVEATGTAAVADVYVALTDGLVSDRLFFPDSALSAQQLAEALVRTLSA